MNMKKFLAMLLAVAMLFAFAACGEDKDDDKDDNKDKTSTSAKEKDSNSKKEDADEEETVKFTAEDLEGEWNSEIPLEDMLSDGDKSNKDLMKELKKFAPVIGVTMTFEDGGLLISYSQSDYKEAMESYKEAYLEYMVNGGYAKLMETTQEEVLDELKKDGKDLDDLREWVKENYGMYDDEVGELEVMEEPYDCDIEGNKIYLDNEENAYFEIKFKGDSFKISGIGKSVMEIFDGLTFTKK